MDTAQGGNHHSEDPISHAWNSLWLGIKSWFVDLIDLKEGMDREGTVIAIKSGKMMRGANAWMLICSIMIASLGLDLNSGAVIIGAMLISPLMSPILGIGLGIGTNDRETLSVAIKQFAISIILALLSSTLYFKLTPLGEFTEMISTRTAPTLLDGFVAIFGGLAGIISVIIFKDVIEDLRYKQAVKKFVSNQFGTDCINHRVFNIHTDSNLLVVQLINRDIPDSLVRSFNAKLRTLPYLKHTSLQALPDYRFQLEELDKKALAFNKIDVIAERLEVMQQKQLRKEKRDSIQRVLLQQPKRLDSLQWSRLCSSIHRAEQFKTLDTISFGESSIIDFKHPVKILPQFLVHWSVRQNLRTKRTKEKQLNVFIQNYFKDYAIQIDTFIIHSYD